jgi:hypothetical protein
MKLYKDIPRERGLKISPEADSALKNMQTSIHPPLLFLLYMPMISCMWLSFKSLFTCACFVEILITRTELQQFSICFAGAGNCALLHSKLNNQHINEFAADREQASA